VLFAMDKMGLFCSVKNVQELRIDLNEEGIAVSLKGVKDVRTIPRFVWIQNVSCQCLTPTG
jgi:hypothetical protein